MVKQFFNFIRSLFTTTTEDMVENNTESVVVEPVMVSEPEVAMPTNTPENTPVDAATTDTNTNDDPQYVDVFGNILDAGTQVVGIHYNDVKRRGYYTIRKNYESLPASVVLKPYIEYNKLLELIENGKVINGRKHGFLHVMAL